MRKEHHAAATAARTLALRVLALSCLLPAGAARAQVPDEVQDLAWCAGSQACLSWSAVEGASGYNVYRGSGATLPGVLDGAVDSCTVGTFAGSTSGPAIDDPVAPGAVQWFLVTAFNPLGEGSSGQASAGPRVIDSSGVCVTDAGLVVNEVDYDQVGTDGAEFVEIYNAGSAPRDLAGLVLILVNGLTSSEYARVDLGAAGASLAAGEFLVVGSDSVLETLPLGTKSVAFPASTNNMQNGAPDGVALFDTESIVLLDALSYEGPIHAAQFDGVAGTFDLVEGTAATAEDSNTDEGALARFPDGTDTDDADTDWHFVAVPSPGTANPAP